MVDYVAGSVVKLTYRVLVNGVATNAATVAVTIQLPDGTFAGPYTLAAGQVVKDGVGSYHYNYTTTTSSQPGQYVALWQSNLSTVRDEFDVVRAFSPAPDVWNAVHRKTAADQAPKLTDDDIDALVAFCQRPDGTYNVNKAAAEGWRWKAARAAGGFSFAADGTSVDKTMIMQHCLDMAHTYERTQLLTDAGLLPAEIDVLLSS
jgi:hypothetical protein